MVSVRKCSSMETYTFWKSDNAGSLRPTLSFYHAYLYLVEYKEAFALFDKKGTGAVPRETLGDLLRALGQNPTQAEVADIVASAPREGKSVLASSSSHLTSFAVDYKTFLTILNRPDGFKPAGTPGKYSSESIEQLLTFLCRGVHPWIPGFR